MRTFEKSKKLDSVRYEIRGPVAVKANQMEEEGIKILKLNIGNPAPFGFRAPQNIVDEMKAHIERLRRLGFIALDDYSLAIL